MRRQQRFPTSRQTGEKDNLFLWTIFIILLAGFALACWLGSFYVFGHPEKAFSYGLLTKLGKLDPPKRFQLTAGPRGQFLGADGLLERYGTMPPQQLSQENDRLLRSYLRNYEQFKELVPYIVGPFQVMGAFRLGPNNLFPEGVVALASSKENPSVLLELILPATAENAARLERMLTTGTDITLARTLDLTALLNVRVMPDGRVNLTAIPLLYGSYTSSEATGTFTLEPPDKLRVSAGLPVLNQAAIEAADKHFADYLRRTGAAATHPALMRVQQTEAVKPDSAPVARAIPVNATPKITPPPAAEDSLDGVPVARAIAVDTPSEIPVARAIPVNAALPPAPVPESVPDDAPPPEPIDVTTTGLQPFSATPPAADAVPVASPSPGVAATPAPAGSWSVYEPGRMPRGRLLDLNSARATATQGGPAELSYLSGDFNVSASGPGRAVLRGRRAGGDVRVIVEFPPDGTTPAEGEIVRRDSSRPFQITRVEQGPDGQVNIHVREVTRP